MTSPTNTPVTIPAAKTVLLTPPTITPPAVTRTHLESTPSLLTRSAVTFHTPSPTQTPSFAMSMSIPLSLVSGSASVLCVSVCDHEEPLTEPKVIRKLHFLSPSSSPLSACSPLSQKSSTPQPSTPRHLSYDMPPPPSVPMSGARYPPSLSGLDLPSQLSDFQGTMGTVGTMGTFGTIGTFGGSFGTEEASEQSGRKLAAGVPSARKEGGRAQPMVRYPMLSPLPPFPNPTCPSLRHLPWAWAHLTADLPNTRTSGTPPTAETTRTIPCTVTASRKIPNNTGSNQHDRPNTSSPLRPYTEPARVWACRAAIRAVQRQQQEKAHPSAALPWGVHHSLPAWVATLWQHKAAAHVT